MTILENSRKKETQEKMHFSFSHSHQKHGLDSILSLRLAHRGVRVLQLCMKSLAPFDESDTLTFDVITVKQQEHVCTGMCLEYSQSDSPCSYVNSQGLINAHHFTAVKESHHQPVKIIKKRRVWSITCNSRNSSSGVWVSPTQISCADLATNCFISLFLPLLLPWHLAATR